MQVEKGLAALIFDIGQTIEAAFAQRNRARADAAGALAANLVETRGRELTPEELQWVTGWGEQFFRWQLFEGGAVFFMKLANLAKSRGAQAGYDRNSAITAAFSCLAGIYDGEPATHDVMLANATRQLGDAHPLLQAARQRHAARASAPPPSKGAPPPPSPASSGPVTLTDEERALWITLAFLSVAAADGDLGEQELLVWKKAMADKKLPDMWSKCGGAALMQRLEAGELMRLSVHVARAPLESKLELASVAFQIAGADGKIDKNEVERLTQICQWTGLTFDQVMAHVFGGPPKSAPQTQEREVDLRTARCEAEAQLFMDLRGALVPRKAQLAKAGAKMLTLFEVVVDGKPETFAFELTQPGGKLGTGGVSGPSTLIPPDHLLTWADMLAKQIPASPEGLRADQRKTAASALATAADCLEELLKFIPAGASEVPEAAFKTKIGQKRFETSRARYGKARIEVTARTYRALAEKMPMPG